MSVRKDIAIGVFVAVVGALIAERLLKLDLVEWIVSIVLLVVYWLGAPMSASRYVVIVFAFGTIALVAVLTTQTVRRLRKPQPPPWSLYRQDEFVGVRWRWDYDDNQINARSIVAFCPKCEYRLIVRQGYGSYRVIPQAEFKCEKCGFDDAYDGTVEELWDRVGREIEHAINTRFIHGG